MPDRHTDSDADVLIVGMGPTGVTLAGLLGQQGISTTVFDKSPGLYPLPRAVGMDHEVMRLAQELGVADALAPHVDPYRASQYRGADGQVIKRLDSPPPPHRLGWNPMYAFDQPKLETLLRSRVSELASVRTLLDADVTRVSQDADGVQIDVVRAEADESTSFTGRYLVACDGGSSPVRRSLNIPLTDLGFHENFLVVDVVVEPDALLELPSTQVQFCEPERPSTFVVLPGRHRRWEIMLEPGELPLGPIDDDRVWPFLERWLRPGDATIRRSAAYMFHGLIADAWRRGRIFLAGDAAHMTPPFMAQGMAQGMRDAQNLAWKLTRALNDTANDALLDSYQTERRPHVISTTAHTIDLGRVICERDDVLARARDTRLRGAAQTDDDVPVTYRVSFLPALDAGVVAATPGAGEIVPQPLVEGPHGPTLLDDAGGRGVRVLITDTFSDEEADELAGTLTAVQGRVLRIVPSASSTPTDIRTFRELDNVLTTWLGESDACAVVVRPDHYVYGTADSVASTRTLLREFVADIAAPTRTHTGVIRP